MSRELFSYGYDSSVYQNGKFDISRFFSAETTPLPMMRPPSIQDRFHTHPDPVCPVKKTPPRPKFVPEVPHPSRKSDSAVGGKEDGTEYQYKVIKINSSQWILTQVAAMASCMVDGYEIDPRTLKYVNHNHNAWANDTLYRHYPTFIGGHNYYNHQQEARKSMGFIAGASIRKVTLRDARNPDRDFVYYVDLLVATNRVSPYFPDVARRADAGELKTWSMGCNSTSLQCNKCGKISEDPKNDCYHLKWELGRRFVSPLGYQTEVVAIVYPYRENGKPGKVEFIEMSLVDNPAFKGSVSGFKINVPEDQDIFFQMPVASWNRKNPDHNGVATWANRGFIEVVK